ncbi:prolipoprotein diacylglyceryl transferase, partial [Verrucomicrobiota bacterium]
MYPVLFRLGPLTIHWYGMMMALGFFAALANWTVLGRKEGRDFNFCSDLLFWIMIAGIVGARIAYIAADPQHFINHPSEIIRVDRGGLIYYGGFLGAGIAIVTIARIHKQKLSSLMDFVIASLPLAHTFGRTGCFLNGCCFGKLVSSGPGVRFPITSSAAWMQYEAGLITNERVLRLMTHVKEGRMTHPMLVDKLQQLVESGALAAADARALPVHPVQLYEAAFNLSLFFLLRYAYKRRKTDGGILALYLLTYPVGRFCLEFFRGDFRVRLAGLSVAQLLSITLFTIGWIIFAWSRKNPREEPIAQAT